MVTSDLIDSTVEQIMASSQSDYIAMMRLVVLEGIADSIVSGKLFGSESKQHVAGVIDKLNNAHCSLVPRIKNETYKAVYELFSKGLEADKLYMGLSDASKARREMTVKRIAASMADIISRDNLNMLESSKASYLEAVGHAVSMSHTAGMSRVGILNQTMTHLCKGIDVINYQSGVRYSADAAITRHMRTQLQQAANRDTLDCMEKTGWDLVYIMPKPHPRPSHAPFECRIYSRTGQDKRYPPLSDTRYGQADGIGGINCRHDVVPYTPGQTLPKRYEPPITQDGRQLTRDEWYAAEQRQRLYERNIRKAKRDYDTYATALGSHCEGALHARNRIMAYQAKARTNTRKYGIVRRYDRERCYGLSYQPRGKNRVKNAVMDFKTSDTVLLTEFAKKSIKEAKGENAVEVKKYLQKATLTIERVLGRYKNLLPPGKELKLRISLTDELIADAAKTMTQGQLATFAMGLQKVTARTVYETGKSSAVVYFNTAYIDLNWLKRTWNNKNEAMMVSRSEWKNLVVLHEAGHIVHNLIIEHEYTKLKPNMTIADYAFIAAANHRKEIESLISIIDGDIKTGHITSRCKVRKKHTQKAQKQEIRRANFEFFAECHLEMIGGKKGTRGRAMEEFLKRKGYL